MSGTTTRVDHTNDEILIYEVSDEALETAAHTGSERVGNYTLYYCTALNLCPGPLSALQS
jgi:hypothetical protein